MAMIMAVAVKITDSLLLIAIAMKAVNSSLIAVSNEKVSNVIAM
jgi:hypothetical protein